MARDKRTDSFGSADGASRPRNRRAVTADSATLEEQCHRRKIFIGGLAHKTKQQHLRDHFSRYGSVVDAVVLQWPDGRSRGFGYVTFADAASAQAALKTEHQVGGRQVDVKRAVPGTNKIFVGGLPQCATAGELREYFESFGVVSDAVVMMDPTTNRSRGFGFICFLPGQEGSAAVAAALEKYQDHRLRGKWIEVKSAAPPHKLGSGSVENSEPDTPPPRPNANVPAPAGLVRQQPAPAAFQKVQPFPGLAAPPGLNTTARYSGPPGLEPQVASTPRASVPRSPLSVSVDMEVAPDTKMSPLASRQVKEAWGAASTDLQRSLEELLRLHISPAQGKEPLSNVAYATGGITKPVRGASPGMPIKIEL